MHPSVKVALEEQKKLQDAFNITDNYEVKRFDKDKKFIGMCKGFIFTTCKGTILTNESVNRTIEAIVMLIIEVRVKRLWGGENPQLLPWFSMHSTRYTFATQSYRIKMRGESLAVILGHCREETSKGKYIHPDFDDLKKDMEESWV